MKLCNFASLDPVQRKRGIRGLEGASKQDRVMGAGFGPTWQSLVPLSEELLHDLFTRDDDEELDFLDRDRVRLERPVSLTAHGRTPEGRATVRVHRRGQQLLPAGHSQCIWCALLHHRGFLFLAFWSRVTSSRGATFREKG